MRKKLLILTLLTAGCVRLARQHADSNAAADAEMTRYALLLSTQDPKAEAAIIQAAEHWSGDETYSFSAMELLARLDTPAAFDTLQKIIRNGDPQARKRAYAMLAFYWPDDGRRLETATEQAAILDLAANVFSNLDRRFVIRALGRSSDAAAVDTILPALTNPEKDTRLAAARTLGLLADKRGVAPLISQAAKESDEDVRAACYQALADLGDSAGETRLLSGLEKSDPLTLEHALQGGTPGAKRIARQVLASRGFR